MVEGGGLESRCAVPPYRGFESLPLRHEKIHPCHLRDDRGFFVIGSCVGAYEAVASLLDFLGVLPSPSRIQTTAPRPMTKISMAQ